MRGEWRSVPVDAAAKRKWALSLAGSWVILLAITALMLWEDPRDPRYMLAMLIPVAINLAMYPKRLVPGEKQVERVAEDPKAVDQHRVNVLLFREGALLGGDYGYIAFVDGWMVFAGLATDFSLRVGDIAFHKKTRFVCRETKPGVTYSWCIEACSEPPVRIYVDCLDKPKAFDQALRSWCGEALAPSGEPVLPPLRPMSSIVREARCYRNGTLAFLTYGIVATVVTLLTLGHTDSGFVLPFVMVAGLGIILWSTSRGVFKWNRMLARFSLEAANAEKALVLDPHLDGGFSIRQEEPLSQEEGRVRV